MPTYLKILFLRKIDIPDAPRFANCSLALHPAFRLSFVLSIFWVFDAPHQTKKIRKNSRKGLI